MYLAHARSSDGTRIANGTRRALTEDVGGQSTDSIRLILHCLPLRRCVHILTYKMHAVCPLGVAIGILYVLVYRTDHYSRLKTEVEKRSKKCEFVSSHGQHHHIPWFRPLTPPTHPPCLLYSGEAEGAVWPARRAARPQEETGYVHTP